MTVSCGALRHGTYSAYHQGCRCPAAREAHRLYYKRLREGRQPAAYLDVTGTRRRLEALAAIGWPTTVVAEHLQLAWRQVYSWRTTACTRIHRRHAAAVTAVYDQLCATPGPSDRTRRRARTVGLAPPLAWDDHTIDDPTATPDTGRRPRSRVDDADVTHLSRFGLTRDQIADRLGVTPDSLRDILARRRKAS